MKIVGNNFHRQPSTGVASLLLSLMLLQTGVAATELPRISIFDCNGSTSRGFGYCFFEQENCHEEKLIENGLDLSECTPRQPIHSGTEPTFVSTCDESKDPNCVFARQAYEAIRTILETLETKAGIQSWDGAGGELYVGLNLNYSPLGGDAFNRSPHLKFMTRNRNDTRPVNVMVFDTVVSHPDQHPLASTVLAQDMVAHELMHATFWNFFLDQVPINGLTAGTPDGNVNELEPFNYGWFDELGAMNEHYADVLAAALDQYQIDNGMNNKVDGDQWTIFEDWSVWPGALPCMLNTAYCGAEGYLRNMANPIDGTGVDYYANWKNCDSPPNYGRNKVGWVHDNGGIGNKAFHFLATPNEIGAYRCHPNEAVRKQYLQKVLTAEEGGDLLSFYLGLELGDTYYDACMSRFTLDGGDVGFWRAFQIWMETMTTYGVEVAKKGTFCELRRQMLRVANGNFEIQKVHKAWELVGVKEDCQSPVVLPGSDEPDRDENEKSIPNAEDDKDELSSGAMAGIVVGGVALFFAMCLLLYVQYKGNPPQPQQDGAIEERPAGIKDDNTDESPA